MSIIAPFQGEKKQEYTTRSHSAPMCYCHGQGTNCIPPCSVVCFYKKPSLSPFPFSLIETLLISCSTAHCWPIRRVIRLGHDDNSRWHSVIPDGLQTVWSRVGVEHKSASYLVIKQTDWLSYTAAEEEIKHIESRGLCTIHYGRLWIYPFFSSLYFWQLAFFSRVF